jgi:hypothetical protein
MIGTPYYMAPELPQVGLVVILNDEDILKPPASQKLVLLLG